MGVRFLISEHSALKIEKSQTAGNREQARSQVITGIAGFDGYVV